MMYLYGASVQGIQDFIFKTNKLQEIVGASEIVKNIADVFEKAYKPDEILINTAGNIKAVFNDKKECEKVVLEFSKIISQMAYGITLSQAVIKFDGEAEKHITELSNMLKIQRNKPSIPLDMSINIMKLNPKTAKPAIEKDEDMATYQKIRANKKFYKDNPSVTEFKDFSYMKNAKGKIAVIHIDGNGLGKIVKQLGNKLSSFSIALDKATKQAVFRAKEDDMHIREVIVGGDDVTVICNANDALAFSKNFLEYFEDETKKIKELDNISLDGKKVEKLTACAGIAYCNEKYPFHYAVDLAEALCGVAKNHSQREHSCLMFHNIQSSNYQSWDKFVEDELTISDNIKCDFGAYYLDNNIQPSIDKLIIVIESLRLKDSPSSRLRNWLSELYKSEVNAQNLLNRIDAIVEINSKYSKKILNENFEKLHPKLKLNNLIVDGKTPIYDILQILSITEAK